MKFPAISQAFPGALITQISRIALHPWEGQGSGGIQSRARLGDRTHNTHKRTMQQRQCSQTDRGPSLSEAPACYRGDGEVLRAVWQQQAGRGGPGPGRPYHNHFSPALPGGAGRPWATRAIGTLSAAPHRDTHVGAHVHGLHGLDGVSHFLPVRSIAGPLVGLMDGRWRGVVAPQGQKSQTPPHLHFLNHFWAVHSIVVGFIQPPSLYTYTTKSIGTNRTACMKIVSKSPETVIKHPQ